MPIRIPSTTLPQEPGSSRTPQGSIAPPAMIGNTAAAAVEPMHKLASLAAEIYAKERDQQIETRVRELDIQRRRSDAGIVDGFLSAQGKDAVDGRAAAMAAIEANAKALRTGLKDREVAALWAGQDAALTSAAYSQIDGHYRAENRRWQVDTISARRDLLVESVGRVALGEGYDPATGRLSDEAERARSAYLAEISKLGDLVGAAPERVELLRKQADNAAVAQVADTLIRQDRFAEAQTVLEAQKDRFAEASRQQLIERARSGQVTSQRAEKSQRFALQASDEAAKVGGTAAEQRASALGMAELAYRDEQLSAEDYDAVVGRLERHFRLQQQEEGTRERQVAIDAERFLNENPIATLDDRPALLEQVKRAGLLRPLLEFQRSGRYSTDPDVFAEVRGIPDAELAKVPEDKLWSTLRGSLSNQDLDEVMARRARAAGGASKEQLHILSLGDRVERAARQLGILPKDPASKASGEQQKAFDDWRARFEGELKEWQDSHGKKASIEDVQKLLDLQVKDVVEKVSLGYLWNSIDKTPLTLADRAAGGLSVMVGTERVHLSQIGERTYTQIAAFLDERGVPPTAQNIADRWVALGRPGDINAAPSPTSVPPHVGARTLIAPPAGLDASTMSAQGEAAARQFRGGQ